MENSKDSETEEPSKLYSKSELKIKSLTKEIADKQKEIYDLENRILKLSVSDVGRTRTILEDASGEKIKA